MATVDVYVGFPPRRELKARLLSEVRLKRRTKVSEMIAAKSTEAYFDMFIIFSLRFSPMLLWRDAL